MMIRLIGCGAGMIKLVVRGFLCGAVFTMTWSMIGAQTHPAIPKPDERFKADILLIVAHPDDDTAVATYLAKAVLDEHRRVAVIFTTRGNSGPNAVGLEQSKALADVREMEARHSLAARGITNVWFLNGQDTPTQDVLHSLETLGHGAALEEVVRIVRLTRPEVILTWLPAYVAGENHGDHQASGVVATEAFDLTNVPTVFPEQLEAPRAHAGTGNYGEGLHPWQAKKLYYFSDASHPEFLKGHGPVYLASEVSREKKVPYSQLNRLAWESYATQMDFDEKTLQFFINAPEYFVLAKTLVHAPIEADVWDGVKDRAAEDPGAIPVRTPQNAVSLQLGGPWYFYRNFYLAHGLSEVQSLVPVQTSLGSEHQLWIPILLQNHSAKAQDFEITSSLPAGWKEYTGPGTYHLEPGESYPVQVFLSAPPESPDQKSPQLLRWRATSDGQTVGTVEMHVYMEFDGVGQ